MFALFSWFKVFVFDPSEITFCCCKRVKSVELHLQDRKSVV